MEQTIDGPMESWSDEQVLKMYGYLTGDLDDSADKGGPGVSEITREMQRRGLPLSDVPTQIPKSESMEWDGDDDPADPGSGAIPNPPS